MQDPVLERPFYGLSTEFLEWPQGRVFWRRTFFFSRKEGGELPVEQILSPMKSLSTAHLAAFALGEVLEWKGGGFWDCLASDSGVLGIGMR